MVFFDRRIPCGVLGVALILVFLAGTVRPAPAQEEGEAPDLAAMEAHLEESFRAALEMETDEPMFVLQAWGAVVMQAVIVDRVRRIEETGEPGGRGETEAATDAILRRWQRERPESGGPALFRAFEIEEPEARTTALLAVHAEHPEDPMVVSSVVNHLRTVGEAERASEVVRRYADANPRESFSYGMLLRDASDNRTRQLEILVRWSAALPGDPALARAWFDRLTDRDPEADARIAEALFRSRPAGDAGLSACLAVLQYGGAALAEPALACVARIVGDPASDEHTAQRAATTLVERAAAEGDWNGFLSALDALEPERRAAALITAAHALVPERCTEALNLLTLALEAPGDSETGHASASSVLARCGDRPEARALSLEIVRQAPEASLGQVLHRWVHQVNGRWTGDLPAGTIDVLEERLEHPGEGPGGLYRALDLAYQAEGLEDERMAFLERWETSEDGGISAEAAMELAWSLAQRGDLETAIAVLERQRKRATSFESLAALWALYARAEGAEGAERFAGELISSGSTWEARHGHRLAGRGAVDRGDLAAAERHYWQALAPDFGDEELALELLAVLGWADESADLEASARRICEETDLARSAAEVPGCATRLLARLGRGDAAADLLAEQVADLPDDVDALRELFRSARAAGDSEAAEAAAHRMMELDPVSRAGWGELASLLEEQGRADELLALLDRQRGEDRPPMLGVYRATGRALVAAGRPEEAITLLTEARRAQPEGEEGSWARGWIDQELRAAYGAVGEAAGTPVVSIAPEPLVSIPRLDAAPPVEGTAEELRTAAAALYDGRGGRYDPDAAAVLFARAAEAGDARAAFRLALLYHLGSATPPADGPSGADLHRTSAAEVGELAAAGDSYAEYLLGTAALVGLTGPRDPVVARPWLERAAAQGEGWAWHNLGSMAENGRAFDGSDAEAALGFYRRASEAGNSLSMNDVARLLFDHGSGGADCEEAFAWLRRSAETGNARSASFLANALYYGRGACPAQGFRAARPWLEAALAARRPGARYDLGLGLVLSGNGPTARARGVSLLERAAAEPSTLAAETLALVHAAGVGGGEPDPAAARRWTAEAARLQSDGYTFLLRQRSLSEVMRGFLDDVVARLEGLAAGGDAHAMALLARFYAHGYGGEDAERRAVELARTAAEAGEPSGMRTLSHALRFGRGAEKDEPAGREWLRRCAEAGDSFCMMHWSQALRAGEGVEKDVRAALAWLRRSGEAGNWWAIGDLGDLYAEGWDGVPVDRDEAAAWKRLRADLGDAEAAGWLIHHGYR
jgi:uncharacterized protein